MRARLLALVVVGLLVVGATACEPPATTSNGGPLGQGDGFVNQTWWRLRQNGYLQFATEELDPGNVTNVLAHAARADRDPNFSFDLSTIHASDFQASFDKIDAYEDTSDFDLLSLIALWEGHRDEMAPDLRAAIEQRMRNFRYWYTDPLPEGVIDNKWFWTENHRIILHSLEYLAGRGLPTQTFSITGLKGRDLSLRARSRIIDWLDEKAQFGFSEWHSDVYYQEDIESLTLLSEYAEKAIAMRAAAMLDAFLYDIGIHQLRGNNGVTHGRSYMKDKSKATDEDVFDLTKLVFDTTGLGYQSRGNTGATLLASSTRYRLPAVIVKVGRSTETSYDRETMGVPLDVDNQPFSTDPTSPVPGRSFTDPFDVPFWWELGSQTAWQVVPQTLATINQYHLLDTEGFAPYGPLIDIAHGDPNQARQLAYALRCMINAAVLEKVDTATYRSHHAMLSSAQDYRPGCFGEQYHAWQATLDEDAVVFTTHPGNEPFQGGTRWPDGDKYWTGTGSMPRSTQYGDVVINQYAPAFASPEGPPLDSFAYLPYTHAYFPTERFDEVRTVRHWTIARRRGGYVALWSWRPTHWRAVDPNVVNNGLTKPYDLVADGGPNNVWITEVGDVDHWGSFNAFVKAVTSAPIKVKDLGMTDAGAYNGFDVTYASPTEGQMATSWTGPLTVGGEAVALHGTNRYDNPWSQVAGGDPVLKARDGDVSMSIDLVTGLRVARNSAAAVSTTP
jgi:hypothetical protein